MVAEGQRIISELLSSTVSPHEVYVTSAFATSNPAVVAQLASLSEVVALAEVTDDVMQAMADTVTPQGILAVLPIPQLQACHGERLLLIPDQVRDPGNLGTMLRTAWAAGVTKVLLPPGTVDHTNSKVVRAGMGAHFHLPIAQVEWGKLWEEVGDAQVWLAEARHGASYDTIDWRGDVALIIGGEAEGAGEPSRRASQYVRIPMAMGVESLNAAVAAAILLFEAFRQRSGRRPDA